jgi:hypothetical protein
MFPAIEMRGVLIAVNDASRYFRNKSPLSRSVCRCVLADLVAGGKRHRGKRLRVFQSEVRQTRTRAYNVGELSSQSAPHNRSS